MSGQLKDSCLVEGDKTWDPEGTAQTGPPLSRCLVCGWLLGLVHLGCRGA